MPFTYRALDAGIRAIDLRTLVDASRSLGAGWGTTMCPRAGPQHAGAVVASSFLTATVVLGEFTMASLTGQADAARSSCTQLYSESFQPATALGFVTLVATVALLGLRHVRHPSPRRRAAGTRRPGHESTHRGLAHSPITAIRKTFGGTAALESFDLAMEPGELVSLLGPSGCGKTTALRIAAGFECADSGDGARRRPQRARHAGPQAQHGHGVPELQPVPQPRRRRPTSSSGCACAACPRPSRRRARRRDAGAGAAVADGQPLPAPALRRPAAAGRARPGAGCSSRRCCCSTSRCRRSTPRCA